MNESLYNEKCVCGSNHKYIDCCRVLVEEQAEEPVVFHGFDMESAKKEIDSGAEMAMPKAILFMITTQSVKQVKKESGKSDAVPGQWIVVAGDWEKDDVHELGPFKCLANAIAFTTYLGRLRFFNEENTVTA